MEWTQVKDVEKQEIRWIHQNGRVIIRSPFGKFPIGYLGDTAYRFYVEHDGKLIRKNNRRRDQLFFLSLRNAQQYVQRFLNTQRHTPRARSRNETAS